MLKILPKKEDIAKSQAQERKRQIDDGLALAKKVDYLREAKLNEEKALQEYQARAFKEIQSEIDSLLEDKANLLKWNTEARKEREELLKPLNKEWADINQEKDDLEKKKETIFLSGEQLKISEQKLEQDKEELSQLIIKAKDNEKETEKTKQHTISLNQLAQREYERARTERENHSQTYEKALSEVKLAKETYENGIRINEITEKSLKEKESELIIREQNLARRTKNLQRHEQ